MAAPEIPGIAAGGPAVTAVTAAAAASCNLAEIAGDERRRRRRVAAATVGDVSGDVPGDGGSTPGDVRLGGSRLGCLSREWVEVRVEVGLE